MTDTDTTTGDDGTTLEIITTLQISEDAADEVANSLSRDDLGLIRDETFGSGYHLVRWELEEA